MVHISLKIYYFVIRIEIRSSPTQFFNFCQEIRKSIRYLTINPGPVFT